MKIGPDDDSFRSAIDALVSSWARALGASDNAAIPPSVARRVMRF
jgi:hypothetical protein